MQQREIPRGNVRDLSEMGVGGDEIIRQAEERALERVQRKQSRGGGSPKEVTFADSSQAQNNLTDPLSLSSTPQTTHRLAQQKTAHLEQRMSAGLGQTYTNRPPWYTSVDDSKSAPRKHEYSPTKRNIQKTSSQIDFPNYTAKERDVSCSIRTDLTHPRQELLTRSFF